MACHQKWKFSASIYGFVIPEKVTMQEMFPTAPHIATIIWNVATDNGAVHPLNGNTCAIPHNTILILTNNTPSMQNRNIVWKSSLLRLEFNILSVEFSINLKFSISASLKSYFIEWLQGKIYFGESRILYCNIIYSIRCRGGHLTKKVSKYGKYNKFYSDREWKWMYIDYRSQFYIHT